VRVERRAVAAGLREQRLSAVAVVPARNEEATVAGVVRPLVRRLVRAGALAEVVVVDDGSTDRTAARAAAAGARVVRAAEVLPGHGGAGKGGALWRGLAATTADLVVYVDADLVDFDPDTVTRLLLPLVEDPAAALVKGTWQRPLGDDPHGGGRVTELAARPLLARFFPELSFVRQPLAGEYAGRRTLLEQLPYLAGWGVDIGLLLDAATFAGPTALRQVHLGTRRHRNRPLSELGVPAATVLLAVLDRAGAMPTGPAGLCLDGVEVVLTELPPLATLRGPTGAGSSEGVPGSEALAKPS
jgi:glucosyl-3-phosphoglycerate synthase